MGSEQRALAEDGVVFDRAAIADDRAGVHDHVGTEGDILPDPHPVLDDQPRGTPVGSHRRMTLPTFELRVTPRRSTTRRARRASMS